MRYKLHMIRHLTFRDIDKQKWDDALSKCRQPLLFAQSWYLDLVSPEWGALVRGDYEEMMPLPIKSKLGFQYLVQPNFTAQLGVFSQIEKTPNVDEWVDILRKQYRRFDVNLNTSNSLTRNDGTALLNCELSLNHSYEKLRAAFSKNTKRNLNKVKGAKVYETDFSTYLQFKLQNLQGVSHELYDDLPFLNAAFEMAKVRVKIYSVGENGMEAGAMFVHFGNRIIYFNGASNQDGKEKRLMFAIMNHLIQEHQNSDLILDFKGGQMEGTRRFFMGFGGEAKTYFRIRRRF